MDRKRIVFTVTNDLVTDQRMNRICTTLHNAGYHVTLVGRVKKVHKNLTDQVYSQHRIQCIFHSGPLFYLEYNLRLFLWLIGNSFDAYCAIDADTILPNTLASIIKNKKLIFDAHEYYTEVPELIHRPIIKAIWQHVLDACVGKAKLAYTVGDELANIFTCQYQIQFHVIRNMPTSKITETYANTNKIVWYQGDLNEGRGLEETLIACANLPVQFHIAGDGLLREKLKQLASTLNITDKVIFHGRIDASSLHYYTQKAWLGINVLSDESISYQNSIANKFFDYVQAHVPSVCAGFVEYQKLNKQFDVSVFSAYSAVSIEKSIRTLLNNEAQYQQLKENCKLAAKEWIWEKESVKLINLYKRVFDD